jgi:SAM-dependent methyltransferase
MTPVTETDPPAGASPGAGGHWDDVYRTRAVDQLSWHQPSPAASLRLIGPRPGPDSPAVDVGGGASTLVDVLLRDGWTVTVLDVSAEALAITGRRLGAKTPEVSLVVSDVLAWQPDQTYDVWHDRAVLHFLTEVADRARYVELAADTVTEGGALVIGGFAPDGPSHCSGLPTARRSAEQLAGEFAPRFTLEHAETEAHHTPGGAVQQFTWVRLRRR